MKTNAIKIVICCASLLLGGCTLLSAVASSPANGARYIAQWFRSSNQIDPVAVQEDILRFADDFIATESIAISDLVAEGANLDRYKAVKLKLRYATDMLTLATGTNPLGDLINVVVYVSTLRNRLEEHWTTVSNVPSRPVLTSVRNAEKDIWTIAEHWLNADQISQLKTSVKKHKFPDSEGDRHDGVYASISLVNDILANTDDGGSHENSLFSLLNLDPLAELDPAARELTQTRLFGERTLFLGKHMPQLLEWQAELLSLRTFQNPAITALIDDSNHFVQATNNVALSLEKFPKTIAAEREAIFQQLRKETTELTSFSGELTRTFEEGQRMAGSVSDLIERYKTLNADNQSNNVMVGKDYVEFMAHLEASLQNINYLLDNAEGGDRLDRLEQLSRSMKVGALEMGDHLIDYAFRKLLMLATYCLVMVGLVLLLHAKYKSTLQKS